MTRPQSLPKADPGALPESARIASGAARGADALDPAVFDASAPDPSALDGAAIAARVPHAGRMRLLARVARWSDEHLRAEAEGHDAPDHPLAAHGRLGASIAIEYAAQAMAVHGSLRGEAHAKAVEGGAAGGLDDAREPHEAREAGETGRGQEAVKGDTRAQPAAGPRAGYLASARGVVLHAARLDYAPGPLVIDVRAQSAAGETPMLYAFELQDGHGRLLVEGRAAVVLDDALAARLRASASGAPAESATAPAPTLPSAAAWPHSPNPVK